ncbi:hypothetical protein Gotri_006422 [Gossypium trilobum]|uniref:Uncharacterized protein n=1 Tax=Gossypium trilobum TaxID=34281 RepID=A0A7J9EZT7_9ROSI|nr:hypothetical protein [Gossypium trilobum]
MEQSFFDRMITHLRSSCKYYTGYPKDLGPSRVIHFKSEREFVQLLQQGHPVVVAFTIRGNYTKHLDKVLEEAAVEFYPNVKFMRSHHSDVVEWLYSSMRVYASMVKVPWWPLLVSLFFLCTHILVSCVILLQVECPKYPGFCITRQKNEYPFIEIFHSPEQVCNFSLFLFSPSTAPFACFGLL